MLKTAIEEGMTTLVQDGIQKVLQGLTTNKEVKAVAIK
jgi:type II secretory ATPase GspE/PulE/Tfp pilus assembly ATPase PilB-like protein